MTIKKASLNYSLKNIPIPKPTQHKRDMIIQTEKFIQRLRWKAHFFLKNKDKNKDDTNNPTIKTFGFKTPNNAPRIPELQPFENDLNHLIANIEYTDNKSSFQKKLSKDIRKINNSPNVFVKADKTNNLYEVDTTTYNKLMKDNVTALYKKSDSTTEHQINTEAKHITEQLKIADRVEVIAHKQAYITLKDHKPQFPNNIKCRLINPTKSNIGLISKQILDNINNSLKHKLNLGQLKNTHEALDWFKSLENKNSLQFIQMDIVDFYPSVSVDLFNAAIDFASTHVEISDLDKEILHNARQSLLFHEETTWSKKTGLFDITMGAYDGAQITDLVGLFVLDRLNKSFPNITFKLYRDDGLGIHEHMTPRNMENTKKQLHRLFESFGLKISLDPFLSRVDFLDVTLCLHEDSFKPFRKPNDTPTYPRVA